jgi:hypothetical protein
MNTDDGTEDVTVSKGPAYSIDTWTPGRRSGGQQCSQHGEFCFLCSYSPKDDGEAEDYWTDIVDTITAFADEGKELPTITNLVYHNYRHNVQPFISFFDAGTETEIPKPEWSKTAIQRHITFSTTQWPTLFDSVCENILVSLIARQNNSVVDLDTDEVLEDERKALLDTISSFRQFKTYRLNAGRAGHAGKARK